MNIIDEELSNMKKLFVTIFAENHNKKFSEAMSKFYGEHKYGGRIVWDN